MSPGQPGRKREHFSPCVWADKAFCPGHLISISCQELRGEEGGKEPTSTEDATSPNARTHLSSLRVPDLPESWLAPEGGIPLLTACVGWRWT